MIELVGRDSSKLGSEFSYVELIGCPISMVENHRVTKVQGVRKQVKNSKHILDVVSG